MALAREDHSVRRYGGIVTRPAGPLRDLGPALVAVLSAGVAEGAREAIPADEMAPILHEINREGLAPVALQVLGGGSPDNDRAVRQQLSRVAMAQQVRTLAADELLGSLCDTLNEASIRFVVVKGPAVARLHPHGWPRPYADIDILVEPRAFGSAMSCLLDRGFTYPATSRPPWPWFDRYCREGLNLTGAGEVDVHHHLAPWAFGRALRSVDVIDSADVVTVRGRSVPMASPPHAAVIAVLHILNDLWKGQRGLSSWRDLLVVTHLLGPDELQDSFDRSGLDWLLDLAVDALEVQLPGVLDHIGHGTPRVPLSYRWRMRGLGWHHATSLSRQRLAWAARLPLPQAAAYVLGSGFPSSDYIRERHGSYIGYWRQAFSEGVSTFAGADHRMDKGPARR